MAKKPAKKSAKAMGKKQMKKTKGGAGGGVWVASGDVNGSSVHPGTINGNTWTGRSITGGI